MDAQLAFNHLGAGSIPVASTYIAELSFGRLGCLISIMNGFDFHLRYYVSLAEMVKASD